MTGKSKDNANPHKTGKKADARIQPDTNKSRQTNTGSGYRESTPHVGHKPKGKR